VPPAYLLGDANVLWRDATDMVASNDQSIALVKMEVVMLARSFVISGLVALVAVFMGCQSSGTSGSASASRPASQAITCSKCQVTWVKVPQTEKGRVMAYTTRKSMECPDCRAAVQNFFATGKLEHTCQTCGPDAMEVCKTH
jgi:hypothetical protein